MASDNGGGDKGAGGGDTQEMHLDNKGEDNTVGGTRGTQMSDLNLHDDMIYEILNRVTGANDLLSARRVCKQWNMVATKALRKKKHQLKVIRLKEMETVSKFIETFSVADDDEPSNLDSFPIPLNIEIDFRNIPLETVDALAKGCGKRFWKVEFRLGFDEQALGIKKTKIIMAKSKNVENIRILYHKCYQEAGMQETDLKLPSIFPHLKKIVIKSFQDNPIPIRMELVEFVKEMKARSPKMDSFGLSITNDSPSNHELLKLAENLENVNIYVNIHWRISYDFNDKPVVELLSKYNLNIKKLKIRRLEITGPYFFDWLNQQNGVVSLAIHDDDDEYVDADSEYLYHRIWMPNLKKLCILGFYDQPLGITQALYPILKKVKTSSQTLNNDLAVFQGSFPTVEKLTVISCFKQWPSWTSSLLQFPNVKRLSLNLKNTDSDDDVDMIPRFATCIWDIFTGNVPFQQGIGEFHSPRPNQIVSINPSLELMHELQELIVEDLPEDGFLALLYLTVTKKLPRLKSLKMKLNFNSKITDNHLKMLKDGHESVTIISPK